MAEPGQCLGPQWITSSSTPSKIGWSRLIFGISIRPIDFCGTLGWTCPPRLTLWGLAGRAVATGAAGATVVVVVVGGSVVDDVSAALGGPARLGTSKACSDPPVGAYDRTIATVPPRAMTTTIRTVTTRIWSP